MKDSNIIEMYWSKNKAAISETQNRYGRLLMELALNIVPIGKDIEECVSDTYQVAYTSIPPNYPKYFFAYLARITRQNCFNLLDYNSALKNRSIIVSLASELEDCIAVLNQENKLETAGRISSFLRELPNKQCAVFMRRYWYADSIDAISRKFKMSESKVKLMLSYIRKKLKIFLEKEEISS